MTARLGEFLRFTLESSGANEVPLRREVEFLQSYLEIERIRELRPWWHGEYRVLLKDGTQLTLSRSYRERLHSSLSSSSSPPPQA